MHRRLSYSLLVILAIVWGSSFILMKRGLESFTPFQVGTIRIFISFLCMTPFLVRSFRVVPREKWKYLLATGFLGNGIPAVLFPLAETHLSSALTGMLNSLTTLFTFLVGISLFGAKFSQNKLAGVILGLIGASLLIAGRGAGDAQSSVLYASLVVLATVCYAFSVNIIRHKLADIDALSITSVALLFAGIPCGTAVMFTDAFHRIQHMPGAGMSLMYILILGAFGTALSTVLFTRLVKLSGAVFASSVTYLIPIVAILWGMADAEHISPVHFLGLAGALSGVYLLNKSASPEKH